MTLGSLGLILGCWCGTTASPPWQGVDNFDLFMCNEDKQIFHEHIEKLEMYENEILTIFSFDLKVKPHIAFESERKS